MAEIADAVNSGDASALKALFSGPAVEQSADIDDGIDYFLSVFPHGALSWKRISVNSEGENSSGQRTELVQANYKVSVDGEDYWVFFADFTINDLIDPGNVGLYALGVTPWTDDPDSGESKPFYDWAGSIHYDVTEPPGYPGVYVPS